MEGLRLGQRISDRHMRMNVYVNAFATMMIYTCFFAGTMLLVIQLFVGMYVCLFVRVFRLFLITFILYLDILLSAQQDLKFKPIR